MPRPPAPGRPSGPRALLIFSLTLALLFTVYLTVFRGWEQPLQVYCAHDSVYSADVLADFEAQTGIRVAVRYDSEATKSLGLTELLLREREQPRCDVFWNNELLGTLDLMEQGVLAPYTGPGHARIPAAFKDAEGHWAGFGARLRVYLVNTNRMAATPAAIEAALAAPDLSRVAIAKPLYGTTLTHYSLLWAQTQGTGLQAWHADTRARGIIEAPGNGAVKNLVASGACALGFTDTDDSFLAIDAGAPVAMLPVRTPAGATIAIPNTVAIVRGTSRRADAERLVDFLLSRDCEERLAGSASRQIPLGPVDTSALPAAVRELLPIAAEGASLRDLGPARAACLNWLKAMN